MARRIFKIFLVLMLLISGYYLTSGNNKHLFAKNGEGNGEILMQSDYKLYQNFPNPFNPTTRISYKINVEGFVTLKVFNLVGQVIEVLVSENQKPGTFDAEFDAKDLPSGVYLYKLQINDFSSVKRMTLIR